MKAIKSVFFFGSGSRLTGSVFKPSEKPVPDPDLPRSGSENVEIRTVGKSKK